eukprot:TRINITY_DN4684_c0_g1_i1.p1 TRINITY_DN4684_c0_g1~~TRINITY_DN4684_c0_g1_i1.p1  ORF type:complete len:152 (-),score=27.74 TRINITY_DN4684_c0_g1_i1:218-673(-)
MSQELRITVLLLYRNLFRFINFLPRTKENLKLDYLKDLRTTFRNNKKLSCKETILKSIKLGNDKLEYLYMSLPYKIRRKYLNYNPRENYIFKEGKGLVKGKSKVKQDAFFMDQRIECYPEHIERHNKLLRRQYFMEPPPEHEDYEFQHGKF